MEAKATHKYIGSSPRKMRLVVDTIRGYQSPANFINKLQAALDKM